MGRPTYLKGQEYRRVLTVEARTVYRLAEEPGPPLLSGSGGGLARHTPWWRKEASTLDRVSLTYSPAGGLLELTTEYGAYDLEAVSRTIVADHVREERAWRLSCDSPSGPPVAGFATSWRPTTQMIDGIDYPAECCARGDRTAIVCFRPGVPALAIETDRRQIPIAVVSSYDHASIRYSTN